MFFFGGGGGGGGCAVLCGCQLLWSRVLRNIYSPDTFHSHRLSPDLIGMVCHQEPAQSCSRSCVQSLGSWAHMSWILKRRINQDSVAPSRWRNPHSNTTQASKEKSHASLTSMKGSPTVTAASDQGSVIESFTLQFSEVHWVSGTLLMLQTQSSGEKTHI